MRPQPSLFLRAAIFTAIATLTVSGRAQASALIVPDNFPTIQAAINAASPGDTIMVRAGTYRENLTLNKSVILSAEIYDSADPTQNTTIIDGGTSSSPPAITIPAGVSPMPVVRGFLIRNGSDGIQVRSEAIIEHNYFISAPDQLDFAAGGGGIIRQNVFFSSADDAVDLDKINRNVLVEGNRILYSEDDGVEIRLHDSDIPAQPITITIRDNEIIGCDEDGVQIIDYSQSLDTNRRIVIHNNLIANCSFAGIGLMPDANTIENYSGADVIEAVRVYNNTIYGNDYGISGGDNLVAFNNIIANSTTKGVWRVQGPAGANSVVAYTLFHNNGLHADQSNLGAGNLVGADPLFLSPPNPGPDGVWRTVDDDFDGLVLQTGSPAIDAGVTQYIASNGEAVPSAPIAGFSGSAPDLGWMEAGPDRPPTPTPENSPTPTQAPTGQGEVVSKVSASGDDAEETVSSGSLSITSSDLELGMDGTSSQLVGMRFNNIAIPRGASILNAYVEFEVDETSSASTSLTLQGQASDHALAFSTSSRNISSRPRTAAQVAWNGIPSWTVIDAKWQTPDLSPIVQEIVDRPGWISGNSIVIMVSGSGERTAEAYDGEPPAAPKLVLTYTTGDPPTPTPTPTATATFTPSHTPTETGTPSQTLTPTPPLTPTETGTPTQTFTPTFTATPSGTATDTQTPTTTPTSSPTTAVSDVIFADGFESGNLSFWSSRTADSGDLSASTAARLNGNYGMQAVLDDNNSIYVTDDSPNAERRYRARFYFDPNSLSMATGNAHYLFHGYTGTSTLVLRVELRYSNGSYQLRAALRNDKSSWINTNWFTINDAPHAIEIDWRASTASGANNGGLTFWIDGTQRANLAGVDNDTRRIDRIQLGAVAGVDSGTRGRYYFDGFEARRQTYIGP
ncbi:MAG TPA: right-handed parallel beta-helix repeat-containing protein [Anaerolineales bacterium]|nr:right-handed parallel beta-helix repeat-containing protein [Anaerolineales bacterium]